MFFFNLAPPLLWLFTRSAAFFCSSFVFVDSGVILIFQWLLFSLFFFLLFAFDLFLQCQRAASVCRLHPRPHGVPARLHAQPGTTINNTAVVVWGGGTRECSLRRVDRERVGKGGGRLQCVHKLAVRFSMGLVKSRGDAVNALSEEPAVHFFVCFFVSSSHSFSGRFQHAGDMPQIRGSQTRLYPPPPT